MIFNSREDIFRMCEQLGVNGARAWLEHGNPEQDARFIAEWLLIAEDRRKQDVANNEALRREIEKKEARERYELEAKANSEAIAAAKASARWTMIAAIAAAVSVIYPLLQKIIETLMGV